MKREERGTFFQGHRLANVVKRGKLFPLYIYTSEGRMWVRQEMPRKKNRQGRAECGRKKALQYFLGGEIPWVFLLTYVSSVWDWHIYFCIVYHATFPRLQSQIVYLKKKIDIHICFHIPSEMTSINCPDEETAFQDAIYTSKHTWFTKNETSFALAGRAKEMQKHTCLLLCIFCTIDRVICLLRIRLQQTLSVTHLLPLMRLSGSSVQPLFMASLSKITLVPKNYFDGRADEKHDI